MRSLEPPDSFHLEAAQGWLELGNPIEAEKELDRIAPQLRDHPHVLVVHWLVCAKAEKWSVAFEIASEPKDFAVRESFRPLRSGCTRWLSCSRVACRRFKQDMASAMPATVRLNLS